MSDHFKDWAARKEIKLEQSTAYHPQTDGQLEIVKKATLQAARAFKVEGNESLQKLSEIQLNLNSRANTTRQHSPFFSLPGFEAKLGSSSLPYLITSYTPAGNVSLTPLATYTPPKSSRQNKATRKGLFHHFFLPAKRFFSLRITSTS